MATLSQFGVPLNGYHGILTPYKMLGETDNHHKRKCEACRDKKRQEECGALKREAQMTAEQYWRYEESMKVVTE